MGQAPPRRAVRMGALLALMVVVTASACSVENKPATVLPQSTASAVPTADPDPAVSATGLPDGVDIDASDSESGTETAANLAFVSPIYTLTPNGPLPKPASVRLRLDNALPSSTTVLVVTRASATQPWTWQAGRLSTDLRHVEYAASNLAQVAVLSMDRATAQADVLRDFTPGIGTSAPLKVARPTCAGEADALKDDYSFIVQKSVPTLLACFGLEDGKRVLRVTNRRPVPVQVVHPGVFVVKPPPVGTAWEPWAKALGGTNTVLSPGRTVTYSADLQPRTQIGIAAAYGSGVVSLRILQAGVRAVALSLNSAGVGPVYITKTLTSLLARPGCAKTIGKGSDAVLAGCLSPGILTRTFGSEARLVAPFVSSPAFKALARTQAARLVAQAPSQVQRIVVKRAAPDFSALVGYWSGHTRLLTVTGDGVVTEKIQDGCCDLIIKLTYQLTEPVTKDGVTRAQATITNVKVGKRKLLQGSVPKVGKTGTITLRGGVIRPPYFKTNYCDPKSKKQGTCGA
jgi:hypothetical protein